MKGNARPRLDALLDAVGVGIPEFAKSTATINQRVPETTPVGLREFEEVIGPTARSGQHAGLMLFIDEIQAAGPVGLRTLTHA